MLNQRNIFNYVKHRFLEIFGPKMRFSKPDNTGLWNFFCEPHILCGPVRNKEKVPNLESFRYLALSCSLTVPIVFCTTPTRKAYDIYIYSWTLSQKTNLRKYHKKRFGHLLSLSEENVRGVAHDIGKYELSDMSPHNTTIKIWTTANNLIRISLVFLTYITLNYFIIWKVRVNYFHKKFFMEYKDDVLK